jgi:pyrimidine operon attenuation protein/uracil phosphoribosyltransferase
MSLLLNEKEIAEVLERLCGEIARDLGSQEELVVIGIRSRGEILAARAARCLSRLLRREIPCGTLDITLYRDDLNEPQSDSPPLVRPTEIDFDVNGKTVLLVDDVLFTGRSVRAAMDALTDLGRPRAVRLAVLIDRGNHELPIRADYVGRKVEVEPGRSVQVRLRETDQIEQITVEQDG